MIIKSYYFQAKKKKKKKKPKLTLPKKYKLDICYEIFHLHENFFIFHDFESI